MPTKFYNYEKRPKKLTASFCKKEYAKLTSRVQEAESSQTAKEWINLFRDWNDLSAYISGEACRVGYEYSKDMSNKQLEGAEKYMIEKISPAIDKPEHELAKAFLASRYVNDIAKEFGEQLIPITKTALKPLDPINTELGVKTSNLSTKYEKILAAAKIKVNGETLTIEGVRALQFSDDEKVRKAAYRATGNWILSKRKQLVDIYDQQVQLRNQMGVNLGYKNYIPLAYQIRGRQNYDQSDVEKFRELVKKYFVPLYTEIAKDQAKTIGKSKLRPWDIFYHPDTSIPLNSVPVNEQLDRASKVFESLSPRLAKHFNKMRKLDLIELEARPKKQAGAYCIPFYDEKKVGIFLNSTGNPDDVRVLTHEMGHAFQFWESMHIESVELRAGTNELAEVYSMGMEFLSLPYMDNFFTKENAKKYAKFKWIDSIYTICYVCAVDEFQHWVYENAHTTAEERDSAWVKIYSKYLPFIDFSGLEKYQATRWYMQRHIFVSPFYYIDYGLAESCAMQIGVESAEHHGNAVEKYLDLCKIGGTMSFLDAVKYAKLESPFSEPSMKNLSEHIRKLLF